jgi:hypothetical protein
MIGRLKVGKHCHSILTMINLSDRLNLFLICHGRDRNCICDICGNNVCHADEFDLVITVAVLGIVTDSIDDNCDGDTSGNIV